MLVAPHFELRESLVSWALKALEEAGVARATEDSSMSNPVNQFLQAPLV